MAARKTEAAATIEINPIDQRTSELYVLGVRPLICNRMSQKAARELLAPAGRKTAAARQSTLKHDPLEEFRGSPYTLTDPAAPTLLAVMSSAFKAAMATAALDLPGQKRAQIGRLVWVEDDLTPVYGTPKMFMSVVRSADFNRTPDIRTRAIVWPWAAVVRITYVVPLMSPNAVVNLAAAGGKTAGIGDWRPEKGKGSYGQYALTDADDRRFLDVLRLGREHQRAAMAEAEPYDQETRELLAFWQDYARQRKLVGPEAEPDEEPETTEADDLDGVPASVLAELGR
jgi:hypothetical protein